MPKILLILIFSLIILGQIFAVKDYTPITTDEQAIHLEDLYFDEKYVDMKKPIQIIEITDLEKNIIIDEDSQDKSDKNCIYFNYSGVPYVDVCKNQEKTEIFSTDF